MGSSQSENQQSSQASSSNAINGNEREPSTSDRVDKGIVISNNTHEDRRARFIYSTDGASSRMSTTGIPTIISLIKTKCISCNLSENKELYEWELVGPDVLQTAFNFRREHKPWINNTKILEKKMISIYRGYATLRLDQARSINSTKLKQIRDLFKKAVEESDPRWIIKAYTTSQKFSKILNNDMARIVMHDIKNGCSKFSCNILYLTQDGTKSIANILYHHPKLTGYEGSVYRGALLSSGLEHFQVGCYVMNNTFLSTSKDPTVTHPFSGYHASEKTVQTDGERCISICCTYIIKNAHDNRCALDISEVSEYPDEEEVLLLPYSVFRITKRKSIELTNPKAKRIEIELEQCDDSELISALNHS